MLHIGCHLSSSKGYRHMGEDALSINADTFQFFTRNPRGSKAKKADPKDAEALRGLMEEHAFAPVLGHAPYTLNACALDEGLRAFARDAMREDVMTLDTYLPHMLYNFHPGSHVGQGIDVGMGLIVELLDAILRPEQTTRVLLETMSGKGTEVGSRFEELGHILRSVSLGDKMGVCLDTCHVYSAGYDIVNDLDGVLEQFDRHVGLQTVRHPPERQPDALRQPQGSPRPHRRRDHRAGGDCADHQPSRLEALAVLSGNAQ